MSVGEVVGLAMTVGLLGAVAGGLLAEQLLARGGWRETTRRRCVEALSRWLAARLTLNRTAASFVVAFRAFASEPRGSCLRGLRIDEAQRARARLFAALRDLDLAEATLIAWSPDSAMLERMKSFGRVTPATLRAAVNGGEPRAARFIRELHRDDRRAIAFVRSTAAGFGPGSSRLRRALVRLAVLARSIADQWNLR